MSEEEERLLIQMKELVPKSEYSWIRGCNIYSCLDCTHPKQYMLRNDNNRDANTYTLEASSLQQWIQALLDGTLHFDWDTAEKVSF